MLLFIKKIQTESLLLYTILAFCKIFQLNDVLPHLYWKESFRVSALQKKDCPISFPQLKDLHATSNSKNICLFKRQTSKPQMICNPIHLQCRANSFCFTLNIENCLLPLPVLLCRSSLGLSALPLHVPSYSSDFSTFGSAVWQLTEISADTWRLAISKVILSTDLSSSRMFMAL